MAQTNRTTCLKIITELKFLVDTRRNEILQNHFTSRTVRFGDERDRV